MMTRLAQISALGLLTLCLSVSADAQRGEAQGGRGPRPGQLGGAVTAHYPPVFFREDFKFDKSVPNVNNEREPEHPIVPGDVANPNLEVRLYGDKAGTRTVLQPYNDNITYVMERIERSLLVNMQRRRDLNMILPGCIVPAHQVIHERKE